MFVPSDTLLLAEVFKNFRNMCLEIYYLDSAEFLFVTRISMAYRLKKYQSKNRHFNWYRYVSDGRKSYQRWICHAVPLYAESDNIFMKSFDKYKKYLYLKCWDANNVNSRAISQKFLLVDFKWVEEACQCKKKTI